LIVLSISEVNFIVAHNKVYFAYGKHTSAAVHNLWAAVRLRCRRKKLTFTISSPDEFLVLVLFQLYSRL